MLRTSAQRKLLMRAGALLLVGFALPSAGLFGPDPLPQPLPDLQTTPGGTLAASIPIEIPVGTRGVAPALSLAYNSAGGESASGMGWQLAGLSYIARDPSRPVQYAGADRYVSSDVGQLVLIDAANRIYHSRDESFLRFQAQGSCGDGPCSWLVRDRNGNRFTFGATADSRIEALGRGASVRVWALTRMEDAYGNGYDVSYIEDGTHGSFYPDRIQYADREIRFEYDSRLAPFALYRDSAPVRESRELEAIAIRAGGSEIRRYELNYTTGSSGRRRMTSLARSGSNAHGAEAYQPLLFEYSDAGGYSPTTWEAGGVANEYLLRFPVDQNACFIGAGACTCVLLALVGLPCLGDQLSYATICTEYKNNLEAYCAEGYPVHNATWIPGDFEGDGRTDLVRFTGDQLTNSIVALPYRLTETGGGELSASSAIPLRTDSLLDAGDVNGDGRTDLVARGLDGRVLVYPGTASGLGGGYETNPAVYADPQPSSNAPSQSQGFVADVNGDGRADYIRILQPAPGVFTEAHVSLSTGGDFAHPIGFDLDDENPEFQSFVDMDGDARAEYVRIAGGQLRITRFEFSNNTQSTQYLDAHGAAGVDRNRWLADVNGDGRADFVRLYGGTLYRALYTGADLVELPNLNVEANAVDKGQWLDLDGDGRADFVYDPGDGVRIYFGNGQYVYRGDVRLYAATDQRPLECQQVAQAYLINNQNCDASLLKIERNWTAGDVNGDGKTDLITVHKSAQALRVWAQPAAVSGDLLTRITSGPEREASVVYQNALDVPSAVDYAARNYPILPAAFPQRLVRRLAVRDGYIRTEGGFVANETITELDYAGGRYRSGLLDDRAALGFTQISQRNVSNGARVETEYNQGGNIEGTPRESRAYHENGNLLSRTQQTYNVIYPFGRRLILPASETTQLYEGGALLQTAQKNYAYDGYGNPTTLTETVGGETLTTDITYAVDLAQWNPGRPTQVEKTNGATLLSRERVTYAGVQPATRGVWSDVHNAWATTSYAYDARGNLIEETDPLGNRMQYQYDSDVFAFVTRKTNALGHQLRMSYDTALGLELESEDANGATLEKDYDGFGRPIETRSPGGGRERVAYYNIGDSRNQYIESRVTDGSQNNGGEYYQRVYSDAGGNEYRREKEGFLDLQAGVERTVVQETYFDTDGRPTAKTNEYVPSLEAPLLTRYDYNGPDEKLSRIRHPDGRNSQVAYAGLVNTAIDVTGRTSTVQRNALGQVVQKSDPGGLITQYQYDRAGRLTRVTDPGGGVTNLKYSTLGQKIEQSDPDTGLSRYYYDLAGRLTRSTDSRGISIDYEYDAIGRVTRLVAPDQTITYVYDESGVANGIGRLTSVTDSTGQTRFGYDNAGRPTEVVKQIDQYTLTFRGEYDAMGRLSRVTYPEGSIVERRYSDAGYLSQVLLDNHAVVSYLGPFSDGTRYWIERRAGNGVNTRVYFDRTYMRATAYETTLKNGQLAQDRELDYDAAGNIVAMNDALFPQRSQTFQYDALDRLTQATGHRAGQAYTENYVYNASGNLLTKGDRTLQYARAQNRHAVTRVVSPQGTTDYQYDEAGNMTRRDKQTLEYSAAGRLQTIRGEDLAALYTYAYDYTGYRVKSVRNPNSAAVYWANGPASQYELAKNPGQPDRHTIYIRGIQDELVGQYTRENVTLASFTRTNERALAGVYDLTLAGLSTYAINKGKANDFEPVPFSALRGLALHIQVQYEHGVWREIAVLDAVDRCLHKEQNALLAALGLATCALLVLAVVYYRRWRTEETWGAHRPSFVRVFSVLGLAYITLFSQAACLGILSGGDSTDAPWALAAAIPQNTPSVRDDPGDPGLWGGSGGDSGAPVTGFYYFHPDHLGSVSMLTDAQGNQVSGIDISTGLSHVSYLPYGEVDRTNSDGPDIFRYKYTGQMEDAEVGLNYYRARFYDPQLGRFIQADSMASATEPMGMNRFMYVEGNPLKFNDPSGHNAHVHMFNQIVRNISRGISGGVRWAADAMKSTTDRIAGGKKANDSTNSIDVGIRKVAEAGTFVRRMFTSSRFLAGLLEGIADYTVSLVHNAWHGRPPPYITYHNGGFAIHNSYFAGIRGNAYVSRGGPAAHVPEGATKATLKHEVAHIAQGLQGGGLLNYGAYREWDADLRAGTFRYTLSGSIMRELLPKEVHETLFLHNLALDPVRGVIERLSIEPVVQSVRTNGIRSQSFGFFLAFVLNDLGVIELE